MPEITRYSPQITDRLRRANVDKAKIHKLRDDIERLLKTHNIEHNSFQLRFTVPKAYYESIKHNFSEPRIIDAVVGTSEIGWSIYFQHMHFADDWTDEEIADIAEKFNKAKYGWEDEHKDE